jgi:hypothetical protein
MPYTQHFHIFRHVLLLTVNLCILVFSQLQILHHSVGSILIFLNHSYYTKKVIYCGTQNNVLLLVYITTIIHIQNQNKVVEFLVAWLFTMPHV